jgi:signal transduction histidine kinase
MENPAEDKKAAGRILAVTEEELRRIVLDLHDGPVQQLFAAKSQLSGLELRLQQGEPISHEEYQQVLKRVSRALEAALGEIRGFLGTFRPPDFAKQELVEMLNGLFLHHELTTETAVQFTINTTYPPIPLPVKITLYRICQEALSNAYRHAGATEQQVDLDVNESRIRLQVADNGSGFTPPPLYGPEATESTAHIGLRGMRDRVELVNGCLQLESTPGEGTKIIVEIPCHG